MTSTAALQPAIIRTERGLTVAGTRVTLYDILEYLTDGWTSDDLCRLFGLHSSQLAAATMYIDRHRAAVEAEYRAVIQQANDSRRYWDTHNHERLNRLAAASTSAGQGREAAWAKLRAWQQRLATPA